MQDTKFYFTLLLCKAIKIYLPEGRMYVVKEGKTLKITFGYPKCPNEVLVTRSRLIIRLAFHSSCVSLHKNKYPLG